MKHIAVFIAAACLAASAHAQLYRCQKGGGIVYSETPCAPNAVRKELDGQAPSTQDAIAARKRAAIDKIDSQIIDNRRSTDAAIAQVYADQGKAEQDAKKRRCEQHLARAAEARRMKDVYITDPFKNAEDAKRKAAEDAHFSECYASNGR